VPTLPSSILEPLWVQIAALLADRQVHHPLGCHRPRIPDRLVFDKLIQILVFGCGYRRIADASCSATTLRRRRDEWISAGVAEQLHHAVLAAYDQPCRQVLSERAWPARSLPEGARSHPSRPPLGDRTHSCLGNRYGKLRWCTERRQVVIELWLALSTRPSCAAG
jgi:transposase